MNYNLIDCFGWLIYGVYQWVRYRIPLVNTLPVNFGAPIFWLEAWPGSYWRYGLDSQNRPDSSWIRRWLEAVYEAAQSVVEHFAGQAKLTAISAVRRFVGYVKYGFPTLSDWIDRVYKAVGTVTLSWASSLSEAAQWLRRRLPAAIRYGWRSWTELFDSIVETAKEWARARYEEARTWASTARAWVLSQGQVLLAWYNSAQAWLAVFMSNPVGRVKRWLGSAWDNLETFARSALPFYYALWTRYAALLGEFLGDPLGFLYDRVEDELVRRW